MIQSKLKLYIAPNDSECTQLVRKLSDLNTPLSLLDVTTNREAAKFMYAMGFDEVPQCFDGDVYVGNDYNTILEYVWINYDKEYE